MTEKCQRASVSELGRCEASFLAASGPDAQEPGAKPDLVLVVDDESAVRTIVCLALESHGFRAVAARNGAIAAALYTQLKNQIGVVFTDLTMPVMDGVTLVRVLRKLNPDVKVIASSSDVGPRRADELRDLGVRRVLAKPCRTEDLLAAVREALDGG